MSTISCMDRYVNRYIMQHSQQPQPQHMNFYQNQNGPPTLQPHHYPQMATPPPQQQAGGQTFDGTNYMVGCYPNANGWTGIPLISTVSRRPRKFYGGKNGTEFDETAMSRLALHAHGAPLILSGRYRGKTNKKDPKPAQQFKENVSTNVNSVYNHKSGESKTYDTGAQIYDASNGVSSNDTCLPRIIKPRKRRKKDRKPTAINQTEPMSPQSSVPTTPTITTVGLTPQLMGQGPPTPSHLFNLTKMNSNEFFGNNVLEKQTSVDSALQNDQFIPNNYYNFNDISPAILPSTLLSSSSASSSTSSIASSPISLSNSSLSSASQTNITSSCSCRLCDPFCKIWAFPLRRSCSDNSAELDIYNSSSDTNSVKKDVGVIGGNRLHVNQKHTDLSIGFSFLDMMDFANYQQQNNQQKNKETSLKPVSEIDRFRNESLSDSGDSGCDILSGLHLSDDILLNLDFTTTTTITIPSSCAPVTTSTTSSAASVRNVRDPNELISDNLNDITKQLSEFTLIEFNSNNEKNSFSKTDSLSLSSSSDSGSVFSDNSILSDTNNNLSFMKNNENIEKSSFEKNHNEMYLNFDSISKSNLFSVNNLNDLLFECQNNVTDKNNRLYNNANAESIDNNLKSPSLVNKHATINFSLDTNNNLSQHAFKDTAEIENQVQQEQTQQQQSPFIPDKDCSREIFNCFDMVWKGNDLLK